MNKPSFTLIANLVDAQRRTIEPTEVRVTEGVIANLQSTDQACTSYLVPGFVDAHIHIESSMLVPAEFARAAVVHGTIATVSDPHEIGNVLGVEGVYYMLENAASVPFKFNFGAPSCVPATKFETAGAAIDASEVATLLADPRIGHLSEVMNFPGVLNHDPELLAKIESAKQFNKPIDGHAPGLHGELARQYFAAGITTDHECFTKEEALGKLAVGCKIVIREGSAARNFEALYTLINEFPDEVMLCSDDKHPDELIHGHINQLAARSVAAGQDVFNVIKASSLNAIEHYGLSMGQLRVGDAADFVELENLTDWRVLKTCINGQIVAADGISLITTDEHKIINKFNVKLCDESSLAVEAETANIEVIDALDGQLITDRITLPATIRNGMAVTNPAIDMLKLVVLNRYEPAEPAIAFVRGFGLQRGALASSVAHDSHNIIAVGTDDASLVRVINHVARMQGGLAVCDSDRIESLALPIAGLMSADPIETVAAQYALLDELAKSLGTKLRAPFMTLSFMALLVIPELKLSDLGLFDGAQFRFTKLFA